jgi:hypothetical protein
MMITLNYYQVNTNVHHSDGTVPVAVIVFTSRDYAMVTPTAAMEATRKTAVRLHYSNVPAVCSCAN